MHGEPNFRGRKRIKLENLPESKTVTKFATLIGRGRCSIDAAAELARDVVSSLDVKSCVSWLSYFIPEKMNHPTVRLFVKSVANQAIVFSRQYSSPSFWGWHLFREVFRTNPYAASHFHSSLCE